MPNESLEEQLLKSSLWLERYSSATQAEINTKLLLAQKKIIELISETKNKRIIASEINAIMNDAFSTFETIIADDLENISELAYNSTNAIIATWVSAELAKGAKPFKDITKSTRDKLLNPNTLIQGHTLEDHLKHLETTTARKMRGIILDGFDKGVGIEQINRDIRNTIGIVDRNQSKTLIRSSILEQLNRAKEESFDYFSDEIINYEYSAKIDGRTSKYCLVADGYVTDNLKTAKYKPQSHYQCRSLWIPRTDISKEFDEENIIVQWDDKTVNHRDGTTSTKFKVDKVKKIPANANGVNAFEYFDESYKKQYLGKTRYQLYKDGKATLKEMIDVSRNKYIPLDDLKRKLNLK